MEIQEYNRLEEKITNLTEENARLKKALKPKDAVKVLPWVHAMISNAKHTLLGVHHMISSKHAQDYLDEFCYKVNRRNFGDQVLFHRDT